MVKCDTHPGKRSSGEAYASRQGPWEAPELRPPELGVAAALRASTVQLLACGSADCAPFSAGGPGCAGCQWVSVTSSLGTLPVSCMQAAVVGLSAVLDIRDTEFTVSVTTLSPSVVSAPCISLYHKAQESRQSPCSRVRSQASISASQG